MASPEILRKKPETDAEKLKDIPDIPKSRELYAGDINDAVITVQQITGFEITPDWWMNEVGNQGTTEEILDRFDDAFEVFAHEQMGIVASEEVEVTSVHRQEVLAEADTELAHFDEQFADDPGAAPLREEFIEALGAHLKEKYWGSIETAWQEYTGYDVRYQRRNAERIRDPKAHVYHFANGNVTTVASINVDPSTGEAINGHDHHPQAESHKQTEAAWREYLASTPEEQRLVIYEGEVDASVSRDLAIEARADTGLLQYLAREAEVPPEAIVSGDPSQEYLRSQLEAQGYSQGDIRLYELIRHISHDPAKEASDVNLELYGAAALAGYDGFVQLTDEQKADMAASPEGVDVLRQQAVLLAQTLNERLTQLGLPEFSIGESGEIALHEGALTRLNEAWDPRVTGLLADIQRACLEIRDKHLFTQIAVGLAEGKRPFVVFGGSHIVALEPVLAAL